MPHKLTLMRTLHFLQAASRLRMQQESKPEPIADLERDVLTMQIELEALRRESGVHLSLIHI